MVIIEEIEVKFKGEKLGIPGAAMQKLRAFCVREGGVLVPGVCSLREELT